MQRKNSRDFLDKMAGSPANSLPSSRNNSLRAGTQFAAIPETQSSQSERKLGPNFAQRMHEYGENCFTGAVAKQYLTQAGVPADKIDAVFDNAALLVEYKDLIAAAVLQWAMAGKYDFAQFPSVAKWLTACVSRPSAKM